MTVTMTPPTASPRTTWLCVVSYASSEVAAAATQPGCAVIGAPVTRSRSASSLPAAVVTDTGNRRAWPSWAGESSGIVPASGLRPTTWPAASMTCTR